jgi:hypothetical protein
LPREQLGTARRFLADACGEIPAFEIQLARVNTFRHRRDNYTVWLRPEPEKPLVRLQAALCQSMQEDGKTAEFRFYEELNDLLPMERRKQSFIYGFWGEPAVKDAIEAIGVRHTEVDLILVNGASVGFEYRLQPGDQVSV